MTPVPTASYFFAPLLEVLHRKLVALSSSFAQKDDVVPDVLALTGIDPASLPEGWDLDILDRRIQFAFRNQRTGYCGNRTPMTLQGPKSGLWGLTDSGWASGGLLLQPPRSRGPRKQRSRGSDSPPVSTPSSSGGPIEVWDASSHIIAGCATPILLPVLRTPRVGGLASVPLPPPASVFFDPLVRALGQATGHRAGAFAPQNEVVALVLAEHKIDPNNLPLGWSLHGRTGLVRRIAFAFGKQRREANPPLTVLGPSPDQWGLTEAGLAKARAWAGLDRHNATARWLYSNYAKIYPVLLSAVQHKLPVSAASDLAEDHVQEFILRLIQRDSLAQRLAEGVSIPPSLLASFAVRSGYTDIRNAGTDPVAREVYGARTEQERKKAPPAEITVSAHSNTPIRRNDQPNAPAYLGDGEAILRDMADPSIGDLGSRVAFDQLYSRLEKVVKAARPGRGDRYLNVLLLKMEGRSLEEIAAAEGVNRGQAASLVSEARRVCRNALRRGAFADYLPKQN